MTRTGCRLCRNEAREFGFMTVMGKHRAVFDLCGRCGLLQARDPYWLAESYRSAITSSDVGTISRCYSNATLVRLLAGIRIRLSGPFLDYGAGYGAFVRHMRDQGYDFRYYDAHCENIFAQGHEADLNGAVRYQMTTAFEVLEHLADPAVTLDRIWSKSDRLLFSTEIMPDPPPALGAWHYHAPHHGQHIAFYSRRTLEYLAASRGLKLSTDGYGVHFIGPESVAGMILRLGNRRLGRLAAELTVRPSLLPHDFAAQVTRVTASPRRDG